MALPLGLDYNNSIKATSAVANAYQLEVQPTNAREFNMSSQIIMQIPCRERVYADLASSKLSFDIHNGDGHAIRLDSQAGCVFDRVDTKIAGSVISSIQQYGQLSNFIYDCQMSKQQRTGAFSIESGNGDGGVIVTSNTGDQTTGQPFINVTLPGTGTARVGKTITHTNNKTLSVSHSLLGGVFSSNRFVPLNLASELELNLYLNTAARAFISNANITDHEVTIRNVKLSMMVVELDARTDAAVSSSGYEFMMSDFSTSLSTVEATATQHSVIIPARYSMLKSLYHLPVAQSETTAAASASQTMRSRGKLIASDATPPAYSGGTIQEYYVSIGGVNYPTVHQTNTNFFSKLMESFHVSPYDQHNVSFDPNEWLADTGLISNTLQGNPAFAIGMDLETVRNKGDSILSGLRTTQSVVQPHFIFDAAPGANMQMTHIAHFDVLARVDPQTKLIQIST